MSTIGLRLRCQRVSCVHFKLNFVLSSTPLIVTSFASILLSEMGGGGGGQNSEEYTLAQKSKQLAKRNLHAFKGKTFIIFSFIYKYNVHKTHTANLSNFSIQCTGD